MARVANRRWRCACLASPEGAALSDPYGHAFRPATADIGAVTALEFLRDGRLLAAAEPTRRGGGSAGVLQPQP